MAESNTIPPFFCSVRFIVTIMAFFGYCLQYMLKINLGIAIVCMVNHTALSHDAEMHNNLSLVPIGLNESAPAVKEVNCLFHEAADSAKMEGEFTWSKGTQGFVLASYFYGYLITQVPGGWLASKYGGRNVLFVSNLFASVLTMVAPFFARWNWMALSACRFFIGLAHGAFWPAMSAIFVCWAPKAERTKMVGSSTSGAWFGNIVALPLGGFLCVYGFDLQGSSGWPSIFYVFGLLGSIWTIALMLLVSDSPKNHWFISEEEKNYLIDATVNETSAKEKGNLTTPWKEIFMSKVCWATFIAHFCNNWGNYLFLTQLPTFMKDVLKFNIKSNGTMSAIPYMACALVTVTMGIVSDKLIRSNILTRSNSRRVFNGLGLGMPMVAMLCLAFVDCSIPYAGVVCLTVAMAFNGFYWCGGVLVNINDIAGSYSGVVFGIANSFGTMPGIIAPYVVGILTKNQTQKEWQIVFFITAAVYFVGALIFWVFGNSHMQPWAVGAKRGENEKASKETNE